MKAKITLLALLCVCLLSCSVENDDHIIDSTANLVLPGVGGSTTGNISNQLEQTELMAGQHMVSGYVDVSLVNGEVVVTYQADSNWTIDETHLFIGELNGLPTTGSGNPKIGHFPYASTHPQGTITVSYTGLVLAPGECVYIAAHAVVTNTVTGQEETAWGAGVPIGGNSWAMMFEVCN